MNSLFSSSKLSNTDKLKELNFKNELSKAENMEEFLNTCSKFYDFKNAKLGSIVRGTLILNIDKIIKMTNSKLK